MDKNHTDKRFRDKLGDYAREPDPHVWERIQTSLNAKKRRRLIPVWWYMGGAAAVLILGLLLLNPFGESGLENPAVTDTETVLPDINEEENSVQENNIQEDNNANREQHATTGSEDSGLPAQDAVAESPAGGDQGVTPVTQRDSLTGITRADSQSESDRAGRQTPDPGRDAMALTETPEETEIAQQVDPRESDAAEETRTVGQDLKEGISDTGIAAAETRQEEEEVLPSEESETEKISIFDAIEEAEKEAVAESGQNRWAVGPSIAPVYYNSFGDGSPISPNFVANSKSGTMNLSYGLTVAYEVSKKLSLRSGVHKVDFGYNTNEVAFSPSFSAVPASLIQTISYSENSKNVVVQSTADNRTPNVDPLANEVAAPSLQREGRMTQQFGYLEVPLEMQYNLVDRKWGVNVIGGVSSLFLVDNSISLDAEGAVTEIGEATNMNDVSFSTNVGLGVFYKLNSSLHVQVQPMFKYHMNTFSQTNGNFQPYSIGVYSGVQLRF